MRSAIDFFGAGRFGDNVARFGNADDVILLIAGNAPIGATIRVDAHRDRRLGTASPVLRDQCRRHRWCDERLIAKEHQHIIDRWIERRQGSRHRVASAKLFSLGDETEIRSVA